MVINVYTLDFSTTLSSTFNDLIAELEFLKYQTIVWDKFYKVNAWKF